jgi:hypothetical protein
VLAAALHRELEERAAEERIEATGAHAQRVARRPAASPPEPVGHVVLRGRPSLDAELELLRKAPRIAGGVEGLAGDDARGLVLSVPVARRAAPDGDHHVGPEAANHPDDVGQQLLARPEGERLLGGLREAVVEGAREELRAAVESARRV